MLRLASADRCSLGLGDAPSPISRPSDVAPLPRPQAALPVGSTMVSAAAIVGARGSGKACVTAAENGRSPMPLLDTALPLMMSLTCTNDGTADRLSHGLAWSSSTADSACSDR